MLQLVLELAIHLGQLRLQVVSQLHLQILCDGVVAGMAGLENRLDLCLEIDARALVRLRILGPRVVGGVEWRIAGIFENFLDLALAAMVILSRLATNRARQIEKAPSYLVVALRLRVRNAKHHVDLCHNTNPAKRRRVTRHRR